MFKQRLQKPDGRVLHLYSRTEIPAGIVAPSPSVDAVDANPHLRYNPLRGEWTTYAAHRQNRTFLPPPEYNPLAPSRNPEFPTELPDAAYDVAVFENRFPSLVVGAHSPPDAPLALVPTAAGVGACEVVVFTQDASTSLGQLPLDHIELILQVWAHRTKELGANPKINYVMPFENRGVEMGVTLYHPHGQIYAYDHIPNVPKRELENQLAHYQQYGRGLLEDFFAQELQDGRRVIYEGPHALAVVPACARYPYEIWLGPKRAAPSITDLTPEERGDMARAIKTVLYKYDHLFEKRPAFPYLMVMHQAPTDGQAHPEAHVHLEFYPPYRTPDKLKYLAGTELGAGLVAMDVLPEDKAKDLQAIRVRF